jgi:futalosine hydrolase
MKITIVAATKLEIEYLLVHFRAKKNDFVGLFVTDDEAIHFLITGIGMMQTAAHLMWYANHYQRDFYFDIGVAGAFNRKINLGEIFQVGSETYGDFGVENDENFEDFFEMGFLEANASAFEYGLVKPIVHFVHSLIDLPKVTSITVNKVHGNEHTIAQMLKKYKADIENMEGLAFYYVMQLLQIPSIEIRSISNYVEKRNKENWKLQEAIQNLNSYMQILLDKVMLS